MYGQKVGWSGGRKERKRKMTRTNESFSSFGQVPFFPPW